MVPAASVTRPSRVRHAREHAGGNARGDSPHTPLPDTLMANPKLNGSYEMIGGWGRRRQGVYAGVVIAESSSKSLSSAVAAAAAAAAVAVVEEEEKEKEEGEEEQRRR